MRRRIVRTLAGPPQAIAWIVPLFLIVASCTGSTPRTPEERGRQMYASACTSCHNPDPKRPGPSGPAIAGSPRELVEARVLRAGYPPAYTPQRTTRAMLPLPQLAPYIDDIAAYLAAEGRTPPPSGNENP